jgi:hypothetical protein
VFYQVLRLLSEKTLINLKNFYTKKDKLTIKLFLSTKQFKTKLSVLRFCLFFYSLCKTTEKGKTFEEKTFSSFFSRRTK